jgi:hypothetical protein
MAPAPSTHPAPTVESWNEKDQQIEVAEGGGFLYSLKLRAKVEAKPSLIYDILTDPASVEVFRNIKVNLHPVELLQGIIKGRSNWGATVRADAIWRALGFKGISAIECRRRCSFDPSIPRIRQHRIMCIFSK